MKNLELLGVSLNLDQVSDYFQTRKCVCIEKADLWLSIIQAWEYSYYIVSCSIMNIHWVSLFLQGKDIAEKLKQIA